MRIALIGLQGAGKTTVFNAVAETPVEFSPGALQTETHVQVVKVHDPRLDACRDIFQPKKFTPAGLELWDPPGLPAGTMEADRERRTRLLSKLRDADAYVLVVRDFRSDRYGYERPEPAPAVDARRVVDDLLSADFVIAETRAQKLRDSIQKKTKTWEADKQELGILEKCLACFEEGKSLHGLDLDEADRRRIRGFQFFGGKPFLLLVNGGNGVPEGIGSDSPIPFRSVSAMDAQIDAELAAMDPADRPMFMEEFGIEESAAERFVAEVYRGVGLRSFFTVGEDEVRAWTIQAGDDAVTAAGKIHTDLAKGFVRAEVFPHEALLAAGGMRELKAANGIRLESKDYVVQDGDVVHIRSGI
jgi:ribosome-binding ATPase YchF (GTP1/OBG family)